MTQVNVRVVNNMGAITMNMDFFEKLLFFIEKRLSKINIWIWHKRVRHSRKKNVRKS